MSASPEMRDRVEALAPYGTPHKEIARVLRVDLDVLGTDYEEELATGRTKTNSRVAEALYRTAIAGGREGITAAIFWLKARAVTVAGPAVVVDGDTIHVGGEIIRLIGIDAPEARPECATAAGGTWPW